MSIPFIRKPQATWLTRLLVGMGLALRIFHYLRDPSVWHDEAALIVNVLDNSFSDQLGHLKFDEAAPPLFLWLEKLIVLGLGDSTLALRLLPFLASSLGLILFTWVAIQLLKAELVPWAVLLVAFSDRLLWHTCEAKPYALDVFCACALPALFIATQAKPLVQRLLIFAVVSPITIWLSFPGAFLAGGAMMAFIPEVWQSRSRSVWSVAFLFVSIVAIAFLGLSLGPVRAQRSGPMESCWNHAFASWDRPWTFPWWSLKSAVEMVDYCFRPAGGVFSILALGGVWVWFRNKAWSPLALFVVPIALAWFAACLRAYPFTGARVIAYALPGLALLIASGIPMLVEGTTRLMPTKIAVSIPAVFFGPPVILALVIVINPWSRTEWNDAMDYLSGRMQPTDQVASNAWESSYYFRDIGKRFHGLVNHSQADGMVRLWVLIKADTEADRRRILKDQFGVATQVFGETTFPGVTVFCVDNNSEVAITSKP